MKMSAIGRAVLAAREGVRLTAYKDSVGVWTIGVGHTAACGMPVPRAGLTITAAEADAAFARDLAGFEAAIAKALKVPVSENEFDALVSLAFNVGAVAAAGSTAIRMLNAGNRAGCATAILLWKKPASIIDRRDGERDQFLTPYATALPKARRSDAKPMKAPGIAPVCQPDPPPVVPKPAAVTTGPAKVSTSTPQPAPSGGLFFALAARLRAAYPKAS